jgi:hypothetical protein
LCDTETKRLASARITLRDSRLLIEQAEEVASGQYEEAKWSPGGHGCGPWNILDESNLAEDSPLTPPTPSPIGTRVLQAQFA